MTQSIFNVDVLIEDLRLATAYASRVGLLQDADVLDSLKAAEETLRGPGDPDVHALRVALNKVVRAIAPMTLADLRFDRDPLTPRNQKRARLLQLWLTGAALATLLLMAYFVQSLRDEQEAIQTLNQIQELRPQQKLTALRKIAQYEQPLERPNTSYETYHQKVGELLQINTKLTLSYVNTVATANLALFPSPIAYAKAFFSTPTGGAPAVGVDAWTTAASPPPVEAPGNTTILKAASLPAVSNQESAPTGEKFVDSSQMLCAEETKGVMHLPPEAANYPGWMKIALTDALSDFCFQLKVLTPAGRSMLLNDSLDQLSLLPILKDKVSLRLSWFLPFFYGMLGSILFVMRNVASVRTPAVEWFPILMRISLGGAAGIVVGWFGVLAAPGLESSGALSVPFVIAFLTGYSIELLFNLLDKLIRNAGDPPASKRP